MCAFCRRRSPGGDFTLVLNPSLNLALRERLCD
jgi:hypothetical protein